MASPIVTVKEGKLKGKVAQDFLGDDYLCFLGIPYGKAPTGNLRFKAPLPCEPWIGIKDATKEGPECPSRHMLFTNLIGSEDNCLNLNVYTRELPENNSQPLKPVMVWIHGGGFLYGSNRSDFYGPDYLITEDVVLVCINYRLGVLGFLSLSDVSLEVPGNAGMKDMVLALKWVQKNIEHFGGDPNNVTIFGESAGSASVHYLYLSPLSKGLFHKAIAQSGCALNSWAKGCSNGAEIANNLGCGETNEKKLLEYLRTLPAHKLVEAQHKTLDPFEPGTIRPFGPVVEESSVESAFLSEEPTDIIISGKFNDVPLIIGYTSREGMLFEAVRLLHPKSLMTTNFEREIFHDLKLDMNSQKNAESAASIKDFYFGNEQPSEENIDKFYLMRTDNMFAYGIHRTVSCQKLVGKAPIYFYRMTVESSLNQLKTISMSNHVYFLMFLNFIAHKSGDGIIKKLSRYLSKLISQKNRPGVCHADDLSYLFKTFMSEDLGTETPEVTYIKRFVKLWANFARTGNPTPESDELLNVQWKPVTQENNYILDIGTELRMQNNPDLMRFKFWDSICG